MPTPNPFAARRCAGAGAPFGTTQARGWSVLELAICLAIASILFAGALQGLRGLGTQHGLMAAASLLETDLRHARSLALAQDSPVRFEVQTPSSQSSCYMVYTGAPGSCRCQADGSAQCQPGSRVLRAAGQAPPSGLRILHAGQALTFDPNKGTVTPTATLVVAHTDGLAIHQIVNIMGRVRSCSPQGLGGLKRCP